MNLHHVLRYTAFSGFIFLVACGSTPQLSRQAVLQQNTTVAELDAGLMDAKNKGADYLTPEGYKRASAYLQQAVEAGQANDVDEATASARQGLKALAAVDKDLKTSRNIFNEVVANRERAIKAGAPELFSDEFTALENEFRKAANLIEESEFEAAKNRRPALIKKYSQLELKSVKKGAVHFAKAAIAEAKQQGADDYAPKTLKQAEEELELALSILEADRSQSSKAKVHTDRAIELARRSVQITELINDFDRRNYTEEDKILWYQQQLSIISAPLDKRVSFDKENSAVVEEIRSEVATLNNKTKQYSRRSELLEKRERETRERFEFVQSLFKDKEAEVYRKRDDVLILAKGFYFEPGKSEIKSVNFALLNKIYLASEKFPGSKLVISGHTDSTGNAKINKRLSEERAANVAKFLQDTKGIDPSRISVHGYGAEKPVATNRTKEGRSRNRRIEVLIDNS